MRSELGSGFAMPDAPPPVVNARRWSIVGLIFLFMLINYADKAVIGLSSVPIMRDLHLTGVQFGSVGSAFFLLFGVSGVLGGALADRVSSKVLLFAMAVIWALAQAPMIGTVGFATLFAARVALGAGEGPAFPLALHTAYAWFEDGARTLPTAVVACGAAVGAGVVAPLVTFVIVHFGWHAAFGALSAASLAWAAIWSARGADGPLDRVLQIGEATHRVPLASLATSRTALGVFLGGFAAYWALTLNIVWLAAYLVKSANFSLSDVGWIIALPSLTQIVLALGLGAWADRQVARGVPSRIARGWVGAACLVVAGCAMALLPRASATVYEVPLVAIAFSVGSVFFTMGSPIIAEIAPPAQRGTMLGLTNSIHSLAGLIAPVAMGYLVDVAADPVSGFSVGFMAAGAFVASCGVIAGLLIDPAANVPALQTRWSMPMLPDARESVDPER